MLIIDERLIEALNKKTNGSKSVNNEPEYSQMLLNKNKPVHLTVRYNEAGFWSIFNKFMNHLVHYTNIQRIDYAVVPHHYMKFYGSDDFFGQLFEPYVAPGANDQELYAVDAKNYITYEATGYCSNWLHVSPVDDFWRDSYNTLFNKYVKVRPNILSEFTETYQIPKDKKLISVLIRHPALGHEQIYSKMPLFQQYDAEIEVLLQKYNGNCAFLLATDLIEAEQYFKAKYAAYEIIHPHCIKTSETNYEAQQVHWGDMNLAKIAFHTVLLLSKGDHFLFPNSNMATAALYLNPKMEAHYLIGE